MSDSTPHAAEDNHEGPIKTPKQLIAAVAASFIIPILGIILLVNYVDFGVKPAAGSDGLGAEAVARRLQRVGSVEVRDLSNPAAMRSGEQVYTAQCSACHAAGAAGAPKFGDADAWAPRIKTGYDALLASALNGKGAMGKQGGGDYTDFEIGRAVVFMTNKAGAKFDEPKAPAAAASAASAPN
jgi:cytochrome c5